MIASYLPDIAIFFATTGISNAPGTQANVISSSLTLCLVSPSTAPPISFETINSLNLAATIPIFTPSATIFPSNVFIIFYPP